MGYLADTNIVIWALRDVARIPTRLLGILANEPEYWISAVSIWEISIKQSIGRLELPADYIERLHGTRVRFLPVNESHAAEVRTLPFHHRDPFDRMLIAQARIEGLTILTTDRQFARYEVALA